MQHVIKKTTLKLDQIKRIATTLLFFCVLIIMLLLGDGKQNYVDVVAYGGIIALSLLQNYWYGKKIALTQKETMLWGSFFVYLIVSLFASGSAAYSITALLRWVVAFIIYTLFSSQKNSSSVFGTVLIAFTTISIFFSLIVYAFSPLIQWLPSMNLLYKTYGHNALSYLLLAGFPFVLWRFFQKKTFTSLSTLTLFCVGVVITLSRSVWIIISGYSMYQIVSLSTLLHKYKIMISVVMVSLACLAILLQPQIFSGDHVLGLGISQKGTFLEARGKYWKQALEGFLSSPIIGTGSGSFYLQSIKHQEGLYSTSWYAHNYPLQIIAELGVLGGTLLLLLCFEIWKKARAAALLKPENKILAESIILSFLLSIVSINLDYLIIWMLTWASIGVLVGQSRQPEQVTKAHNPKFVYGFGLVILVIAYMFLIGAEIYQFSLAKGTIVLMPFNTGKTLSYLDTKIGQISYTQANTILLFNKEHPEILAALGKAFENRDERYSAELYKRAIKNSPKNKEYLTSLLTQLSKNPALIPIINPFEIRDSFYNASFQESHVAHPMPPLKEIQNTYLYRDTFNEALSSSLQRDKSPVFSKLYYLWGLNLFGKDNRVSILLLNKAIVLEPEWSYFYLELASLYLNVGDSLQAQKILNACLQQKFAGDHCASYTTDTLPPFGTYKKNIIEEL